MRRTPFVSGKFYPDSADGLSKLMAELTHELAEKMPAIGVVSPHAGFVYSGAVAGAVFSSVHIPAKNIIFCPNHTGHGESAAIISSGTWRMPWGEAPVDSELALRLQTACPLLIEDARAHSMEHSLEVQLPFLYHFRPDFRFVPIALGRLTINECRTIGEAIAGVIAADAERPLLIASSDMSHHEPDEEVRKKDIKAIDRMLALDPEGLYKIVRSEHISMCGMIPTAVMLFAALRLGASEAFLLKYATSGEVNRDFDQVVGYAGLAIL